MPKLHTLDAMRGVAALIVAAYHFGLIPGVESSPYLAVDFFFALSGFVIAYSYDGKLSAGMSSRRFLVRRLIRLYPLFVLGLTWGLFVSILRSDGSNPLLALSQYLVGLLFLPFPPVFGNGAVAPLNGPYWSLILEMHVNIVFVLAFRLLGMRLLGAVVATFATALVATAFLEGKLDTGFRLDDYHFGVVRIGFSFFAGVLLCRLRYRLNVPKLPWPAVLLLMAFILCVPRPESLRWIYDVLCVLALFPILILCGARAEPVSNAVKTIFVWAGGMSYALYAIHRPFTPILEYVADLTPHIPSRLWALFFLAGVTALAIAADRVFDQPVRRWLSQRQSSPRAPAR